MRRATGKIAYVIGASSAAAGIARLVWRHKTDELDATITRTIQRQRNPLFRRTMHVVSWPGFPPQSRTIPIAIPAGILLTGHSTRAIFQLAGWGTSALSGALKQLMRRPRPDKALFAVTEARIGGTSFPSGHVINYTGVYGFAAFLAHRHVTRDWIRRSIVGGLMGLIALVGPSRIYLGHHWFTDVVTSYLLGSSYLVLLTSLYDRAIGHRH